MKIFIDMLREDIEDVMIDDMMDDVVHEVQCIHKDCNGKVTYLFKQVDDGSVLICNKCKRGVIVKISDA